MSYQVLARKWRPKSFASLVGQEHVVRALSNALAQQRLHHAYLFTGTRGVGKTTISRILAKSLNCQTGITAEPCGTCPACVGIDSDRFIDYIEMNAASTRGIDDVRAILEQATYAPTQGRFKVYMLDEVHQLTKEAFNALLKTLEEPPAHVKFILGTTDPQKVPVTILSRCLQFNLRQIPASVISEHLQSILTQENIAFDTPAIQLVARGAQGSMRDALSLLDQAIAYGNQTVNETEVRAMLGAIDQSYLFNLLQALVAQDGQALLKEAQAMSARSLSLEAALNDLANLLQQIAVAQTLPESVANDSPDYAVMMQLADTLKPDELQLYYQIAILGKRDIALAPDEFAGFSMTLLRMLAFRPVTPMTGNTPPAGNITRGGDGQPSTTPSNSTSRPSASAALAHAKQSTTEQIKPNDISAPASSTPAIAAKPEVEAQEHTIIATESQATSSTSANARAFDGNWNGLVEQLKLGLVRVMAQHCELMAYDENSITLSIPAEQKHMLQSNYQEKLRTALNDYFGRAIKLNIDVGNVVNSPMVQINQEKAQRQSAAETAIHEDDFVRALVSDFGAQIVPASIKPI